MSASDCLCLWAVRAVLGAGASQSRTFCECTAARVTAQLVCYCEGSQGELIPGSEAIGAVVFGFQGNVKRAD